jgi:cellulose 1,4-beta-cellobiosidase
VEYRAAGATEWVEFEHTPKSTVGQTVTGLNPSTAYQFRVSAQTAQADSPVTGALSRSTPSGVTSAPRTLTAGTGAATSVPLKWVTPKTVNGGRIIDYGIQYRVSGTSEWVAFIHNPKAAVGQTVTGLTPSTTYQFRVSAQTAQAGSVFTVTTVRSTQSGITTAPRSLTAGTSTTSTVPLRWVSPSNLRGGKVIDHVVLYQIRGASTWTTFVHTPKATTGLTITGLSRTKTYNFRVATVTAQGVGMFTKAVARTTR